MGSWQRGYRFRVGRVSSLPRQPKLLQLPALANPRDLPSCLSYAAGVSLLIGSFIIGTRCGDSELASHPVSAARSFWARGGRVHGHTPRLASALRACSRPLHKTRGAGHSRCRLKAPPSRKEREKDGAPAFGCGESMGQPRDEPTQKTLPLSDLGLLTQTR